AGDGDRVAGRSSQRVRGRGDDVAAGLDRRRPGEGVRGRDVELAAARLDEVARARDWPAGLQFDEPIGAAVAVVGEDVDGQRRVVGECDATARAAQDVQRVQRGIAGGDL